MRWVGGALLVVAVLSMPARMVAGLERNRATQQNDFGVFLDTARSLYHRSPLPPYWWSETHAPNLNPPHLHLLLRPLIDLPRERAYVWWLLAGLLAVTVSAWRVWASLDPRPRPVVLGIGALAVSVSAVTSATIATGQVYPLLAWPMTEAFLAARRGRWYMAAALVGVLATMKPLLGLLLLWIWWKAPGTIAPTVLTMLATIGAGVILFGAEAYTSWVASLAHAASSGHRLDGSLLQSITRMVRPTDAFAPIFVVESPIVRALWITAGVFLCLDARRWVPTAPLASAWLGCLVLAWLIAPKGWIYMAWLAIGPAMVFASTVPVRPAIAIAALALLLPDTLPTLGQPNRFLTPLIGSLYLWTWLALYLGVRAAAVTLPPSHTPERV